MPKAELDHGLGWSELTAGSLDATGSWEGRRKEKVSRVFFFSRGFVLLFNFFCKLF